MALLLMRDSSWINVTAWLIYSIALPMWLILHHCYCVTQIVLMLLRDSYCITVTCDSSCFTVSAWLIYSIALPMWLILHHLLCDSYCINVTTWFKLHHCYLRLTLLYCYCVTHTASVTAWLILRNCYCVTHTSIMLLCDPYFNNVTAWFILHHGYCVTHTTLMLLRDSYCITVTCDTFCFTITVWLIRHHLERNNRAVEPNKVNLFKSCYFV